MARRHDRARAGGRWKSASRQHLAGWRHQTTALLVTLKTDPNPGTVDVIALHRGSVTGAAPTAVSAPEGTLAPFGFSMYPDGTALITLAHSDQDGLFRDGAFTSVIAAGQAASCWMTRVGKYVFVANTASRTISRLIGTGSHVFVDAPIAAQVPTGSPADIDADSGVLGVIDHGAGQSHLSIFGYNAFGELVPAGATITVGVANANGVAILAPRSRRELKAADLGFGTATVRPFPLLYAETGRRIDGTRRPCGRHERDSRARDFRKLATRLFKQCAGQGGGATRTARGRGRDLRGTGPAAAVQPRPGYRHTAYAGRGLPSRPQVGGCRPALQP